MCTVHMDNICAELKSNAQAFGEWYLKLNPAFMKLLGN